ncbi:MAG: hypothetical protein E2O54_09355 [Gammaproteobacteria bacterium]|nr:MAG: hypothetical protein E2O58_12130 [Gammaproteobacteria bacterium]TDJ39910.1 MAG: hypothetical protein E2O54_09355 [Gammaproteobacteria bacterium]
MSWVKATTVSLLIAHLAMWTGIAGAAHAQSFDAAVATLRTTEVYPGKNALFEAAVLKIIEATRQTAPDSGFATQVAAFGPGSTYYSLSFYDKFSDVKPEPLLAEAFGQEEAARIVAMFAESVKSTRVQAFIPRPDLSRPNELGDFEVVWTVVITVNPGMAAQYERYLEQLVEATEKVDSDRHWFAYAPSAGSANTFRIAIPMKWTDLDSSDMSIAERLTKAFGERKSQSIQESRRAAVAHVETLLTIRRPDLSYQPDTD